MSELQKQHDWTWKTEEGKLVLYDQPTGGSVVAGPFKSWTAARRDPFIKSMARLWQS